MEMTKEQKKKYDKSLQFMKENAKYALKNCDNPISCNNCGEYLGYCDSEITLDHAFVCVRCGEEKN